MNWRGDDRAQSVQVGAILLFATLVIALSIYQATIVPSQNADIEYKHSQTVQNQMADVRNSILRSAATGTTQPASVTLGTQYPARVFLLNPPPSTGTLRTGSYDDGTISVSNVVATNDETDDFIDGSWSNATKYLEYEPDYNEYDNAPNLAYGETLLYNYYPREGTTVPRTDQLLVDGNTITLVALNGSVGTTQSGSVSVSPQSLSGPYERVQVTNETAGPVEITVPSRVSASAWENRTDLGGESTVRGVEPAGNGRVRIFLDPGTYTLRTARVGVGSGTVDPGPRYLTTNDDKTVRSGESFTVSVRDSFNNPVGDSDVEVTVNKSVEGPNSKQVSEDGTVTFTYEGGAQDFNATIPGGGDEREIVFEGRNGDGTGTGTGSTTTLNWDTGAGGLINTTNPNVVSCTENQCEWMGDLSSPQDVELFARYGDNRAFASTSFATNGTNVVSGLTPNPSYSNSTGVASTTATISNPGEVRFYATGANSEDEFTLNVTSVEQRGVYYRYYEDDYPAGSQYMPDFDPQTLVETGTVGTFDIDAADRRGDDFAYQFTAYIDVPSTGQYTFYTNSDDGSRLFIDGSRVVNNPGDHPPNEESGTVSLSGGRHNITVTYYENAGSEVLTTSWQGPGTSGKQEIPTSVLTPRNVSSDGGGNGGGGGPPSVINNIEYEDGLTTTGSQSAIQFDIRNVDSSQFARMNGVVVESTSTDTEYIYNAAGREIEISGGQTVGYADDQTRAQNAYTADGTTTIDLTQDAVLSTSGGDETATVTLRDFGSKSSANSNSFNEYDFSGLTRVSSDNWDISVTMQFQNRGDVTYYFEEV